MIVVDYNGKCVTDIYIVLYNCKRVVQGVKSIVQSIVQGVVIILQKIKLDRKAICRKLIIYFLLV